MKVLGVHNLHPLLVCSLLTQLHRSLDWRLGKQSGKLRQEYESQRGNPTSFVSTSLWGKKQNARPTSFGSEGAWERWGSW